MFSHSKQDQLKQVEKLLKLVFDEAWAVDVDSLILQTDKSLSASAQFDAARNFINKINKRLLPGSPNQLKNVRNFLSIFSQGNQRSIQYDTDSFKSLLAIALQDLKKEIEAPVVKVDPNAGLTRHQQVAHALHDQLVIVRKVGIESFSPEEEVKKAKPEEKQEHLNLVLNLLSEWKVKRKAVTESEWEVKNDSIVFKNRSKGATFATTRQFIEQLGLEISEKLKELAEEVGSEPVHLNVTAIFKNDGKCQDAKGHYVGASLEYSLDKNPFRALFALAQYEERKRLQAASLVSVSLGDAPIVAELAPRIKKDPAEKTTLRRAAEELATFVSDHRAGIGSAQKNVKNEQEIEDKIQEIIAKERSPNKAESILKLLDETYRVIYEGGGELPWEKRRNKNQYFIRQNDWYKLPGCLFKRNTSASGAEISGTEQIQIKLLQKIYLDNLKKLAEMPNQDSDRLNKLTSSKLLAFHTSYYACSVKGETEETQKAKKMVKGGR